MAAHKGEMFMTFGELYKKYPNKQLLVDVGDSVDIFIMVSEWEVHMYNIDQKRYIPLGVGPTTPFPWEFITNIPHKWWYIARLDSIC